MKRLTTQEKKQIIKLHLLGKNCVEIGKIFHKTKECIRYVLVKNGYKFNKSKIHQKFKIDDTFFEKINRPEKAYFLGWIVSDGYNSNKNAVVIRLQEEDKQVLLVLNRIIKTNKPLKLIDYRKYKTWKNQYQLAIYSKKISDDIRSLGYDNNKSKNAKYPEFLTENLHSHFIRGLFEGDGCISNKKRLQFYICGTQLICEGIKKQFDTLEISSQINKHGNIFEVRICANNDIIKALDWIYKDCFDMKLNRKFKQYQQIKKGLLCIY